MENVAEFYYNKLSTTTKPGNLLVKMILQLFEDSKWSKSLIMAVNRSIKAYGRYNTYWAILKATEIRNVNINGYIYPLLSTIILNEFRKKRNSSGMAISDDFSKEARKIFKRIEQVKKDKPELENPFDE